MNGDSGPENLPPPSQVESPPPPFTPQTPKDSLEDTVDLPSVSSQEDSTQTPSTPQPETPTSPENPATRSTLDNLPRHLKDKLFPDKDTPVFPDKIPDLSPGQQEALTLPLLEWCLQSSMLPPNPKKEGEGFKIVFATNLPEIEVDGQKRKIVEITGVGEGKFSCKVEGEEKIYLIDGNEVIAAQARIVEQSTETGCLKGSSLTTFLEKQRIQPQEGQALTEEQQKFNQTLNNLIAQIQGQTIVGPETFTQALTSVLTTHPDRKEQIDSIMHPVRQQIKAIEEQLQNSSLSDEEKSRLTKEKDSLNQTLSLIQETKANQINEQAKEMAEKINNGELTPKEIDQINQFLETGNLDSLQKLLEEKPKDDEQTKQKKTKLRNSVNWLKENGLIIGGVTAILFLLMLFQVSKSSSGHQGMMG